MLLSVAFAPSFAATAQDDEPLRLAISIIRSSPVTASARAARNRRSLEECEFLVAGGGAVEGERVPTAGIAAECGDQCIAEVGG